MSQSYELGQFVKMTSLNCDVIIAGGDFNLQPKDLGYKLITTNANLQDSWLAQVGAAPTEQLTFATLFI